MLQHLRLAMFAVLSVFFCLSIVAIPTVNAQNLIEDGEFDENAAGWGGWINNGPVSVTVSVDTNSVLSGKNSYRLNIITASTTSYYIQRNANAPIQSGYSYITSFWAVANAEDVRINVLFEQTGDPYTKYLNEWAVVGTIPRLFKYILTDNVIDEPTNQLKLHFGGTDSTSNDGVTVWVDDVKVIEVENYDPDAGTFVQTSDTDGLVSMEAENFTNMRESSGVTYWRPIADIINFSGTGAMQAKPDDNIDHKNIDNAQENAPVLEYSVKFVTAAPVYVWGRASHVDGYDDSIWFGLDGVIEPTGPLSYLTEEQPFANEWYWIRSFMNSSRAVLNIPSAGVHTFELYMREPKFKIDKIVLTTNPDYIPDDNDPLGPPETLLTDVASIDNTTVPDRISLSQNYPNPFNPSTTIDYSLSKSDMITLTIYNLVGQEVAMLVNKIQPAGNYKITWTADGLPSGMYLYRLQAGNVAQTKKLILQK
jgi:hypothetical protein